MSDLERAGTPPAPEVAEIDHIAAIKDPILRNLRITLCYHELSGALGAGLGPGANWCTFATWASKQAGQTIRIEDLLRAFERLLVRSPDARAALDRLVPLLARIRWGDVARLRAAVVQRLRPLGAFHRASEAVARGNLKVFDEIGRATARFLAGCGRHATPDAAGLGEFCQGLRPGDPPDGQEHLRRAFARYYRARFEPDARARAELVFHANLEIGFHEQTRLQPEIVEAMEAGLDEPARIRRELLEELRDAGGSLRSLLEPAATRLGEHARDLARRVITDFLMTLALPGGKSLRLGRDLSGEFPEVLRTPEAEELRAFLGRIDPTPDSLRASGARDWGNLGERLHFIADLFRAYHARSELFEAPFAPEQAWRLKAGEVPAGRL